LLQHVNLRRGVFRKQTVDDFGPAATKKDACKAVALVESGESVAVAAAQRFQERGQKVEAIRVQLEVAESGPVRLDFQAVAAKKGRVERDAGLALEGAVYGLLEEFLGTLVTETELVQPIEGDAADGVVR